MTRKKLLSLSAELLDADKFLRLRGVFDEYLDTNPDDKEVRDALILAENAFLDAQIDKSLVIDNNYEPREYLVTAIVSAYRSQEFIRECLDDLEGQTLAQQLEIIVVDANSPQNERAIVEEFQKKYRNIRYVRTAARIGIYPAWNMAIRLASGKYITPFSTNDRLRKEAYQILVDGIQRNPDAMLVYGDTFLTNKPHESFDNNSATEAFTWPDYSFKGHLGHVCIGPHPLWRREIHTRVGYFDGRYKAIGDQEFWLRIGRHHKLHHVPEFTGLFLVHLDSLSAGCWSEEWAEIRAKYRAIYQKDGQSSDSSDDISWQSSRAREGINSENESDKIRIQADLERLGRFAETYPAIAWVQNILGVRHFQLGRRTKGVEHLRRAIELNQSHVDYRNNLLTALLHSNQLEAALEVCEEAHKLDPANLNLLSLAGDLCLKLGKREKAQRFYRWILQLDPNHKDARQRLDSI